MTKFEGTFRGRTTGGFGGITISASGVLALVGAGVVLTHRHQAGEALSGAAITVAVVVGTVLAAGIAYTVVRVRGSRRTPAAGQPVSLMRTNTNAIPPSAPRAIAAPAQYIEDYRVEHQLRRDYHLRLLTARAVGRSDKAGFHARGSSQGSGVFRECPISA